MSPGRQYDADVAVVGLGAIGSMAAWRLAVRGHDVHGYERFGVGHDAGAFSGQTRRFSVQSQREPRLTPLALHALELWRGLESATGRSLLRLVGGLVLGPSDAPALVAAHSSARAAGLDCELLGSHDLKERFPQHLVRSTDAGVLDPQAGFLRPELSVVTATRRAEELGATVFDHTRVLGVEPDADGVVVRTESGSRRYAHVVVAPGARARDVYPALLEEMQRLFFISLGNQDRTSEMVHEHHDLYDALLARDAARAREIVVEQIEASRARVLEGLVIGSVRDGRAAAGVILADQNSHRPR